MAGFQKLWVNRFVKQRHGVQTMQRHPQGRSNLIMGEEDLSLIPNSCGGLYKGKGGVKCSEMGQGDKLGLFKLLPTL